MCHSNCKCGGAGCTVSLIIKILVIVGGINWGLIGIGMLMGKGMDWNVINMLLGSMSTVEAIAYVVVGVAAVAKIFGCKCKKCMGACATCSAETKPEEGNM